MGALSLRFGDDNIVVDKRWSDFKSTTSSKGLSIQFEDVDGRYIVFAIDQIIVYRCDVWHDDTKFPAPPDYTQDQNDADCADFETNFKSTANAVLVPKSADGRTVVRMTTASKSRNFNLRIFSFLAGDPSSLVNQDANFNALSDITMTCYDVGGVVTTDPAQAVKSVLDLEPPFNFEIIGGWIDTPASLLGGTSNKWWISCVGVPDVPFVYGGSVNFVYPVNMELVYTQKIMSDGRASQYLVYDPTHHTNKIRWIMKHPTSPGARVQIYIETFV